MPAIVHNIIYPRALLTGQVGLTAHTNCGQYDVLFINNLWVVFIDHLHNIIASNAYSFCRTHCIRDDTRQTPRTNDPSFRYPCRSVNTRRGKRVYAVIFFLIYFLLSILRYKKKKKKMANFYTAKTKSRTFLFQGSLV